MTGGDVPDAARALADVDAIRRRVVNVVGHVLRTPITTMAGMANALEHAEDEETRAMLIEGLVRNGRRVEELLDDLLIAAGVNTAIPVDPAVAAPLQAAVTAAWATIGGPDELVVGGAVETVDIGPAVLERMLVALLDNALKYGHGPVFVRADATGDEIAIHIESMGDGPNETEMDHVFEMLYRGEHAVMAAPGLGIGLPVARQLAQAHGGDVTLQRSGDVTTATITLPI